MIDRGEEQNIGVLHKIAPVAVVGAHHILQVAGDGHAQLFGQGQELPRPVGNVEVGQAGLGQHRPADAQVGLERQVTLAVVKILAPPVGIHEVDAARRAGRVDK